MNRIRAHFLLVTSSLALASVAACQCPPSAAPSAAVPAESAFSRQLMIRFQPGSVACEAAAIAYFAAATHVWLQYVRPMSGNACVVRHSAANAQRWQDDLETLKRHPAVQWASRIA